MLGAICSLGSSIGTSLLSGALLKKLSEFKNQKTVQNLMEALQTWETHFKQKNEGTIVTSGAFYDYTQHYHIVEEILFYALDQSDTVRPKNDFLNRLRSQMAAYLEEKTGRTLTHDDKKIINEFPASLLTAVKTFLLGQVSLQDRGLLYFLCQNNAELEQIKRILTEQFQMQEQTIQSLQEQWARFVGAGKSEKDVTDKLTSWNLREIKNLGDRYNPEVNRVC